MATKPLIQTTGRRKRAVAACPGASRRRQDHRQQRDVDGVLPVRDPSDDPHRAAAAHRDRRGLRRRRHASTAVACPARPARCATASPARWSSLDAELRPDLKRGRLPHPRRAREGNQEVRPQEGPQGAAVLEALIAPAMTLRFGTDGVRGLADELTDELVTALGRAAARVLARLSGRRPLRRSDATTAVRAAHRSGTGAGLAAEGVDVELLGVVPTPAVAVVAAADVGARPR